MPYKDPYLDDETEEPLRRQLFARLVPVIALALCLLAFRSEVGVVLKSIGTVLGVILGFNVGQPAEGFGRALGLIFTVFLLSFGLTFLFWLWVISFQAIVPVRSVQDIYRLTFLLILYIFKQHGPTVFVKDGQMRVSRRDFRQVAPGIIVVDFNSAVVLEEIIPPPGMLTTLRRGSLSILESLRLVDAYESPRVRGTGIIFTRPWERIRGAVDLRKQFRITENQPAGDDSGKRVFGYTRDGIEVSTNQWAIFTIGRPPEILQFAYVGEELEENLRVLTLEDMPDDRLRIKSITDEFRNDPLELHEIHQYAPSALRASKTRTYEPLRHDQQIIDPRKRSEKPGSHLPGTRRAGQRNGDSDMPQFDAERVFAAVFAQARTASEEIIPWVDLPRRVSIDFFREELSRINFDDLYQIGQDGPLPVVDFKKKVKNRVRNSGMLAYRVIGNRSGCPLEEGSVFERHHLIVTPSRLFTTSKILRDRGIGIIASGFGDLIPASEAVYKLRLDAWRSTWQRDTNIKQANADLDSMREHARARANAQRDLVHTLSIIFDKYQTSEEVLSMRIFQALENLAEEPQTRTLLPPETLNLLRSVHDWILPGESSHHLPALPGEKR